MSERDIDLLKFYRNEIHFESGLLSGRLNAFMSLQSFLDLHSSDAVQKIASLLPSGSRR